MYRIATVFGLCLLSGCAATGEAFDTFVLRARPLNKPKAADFQQVTDAFREGSAEWDGDATIVPTQTNARYDLYCDFSDEQRDHVNWYQNEPQWDSLLSDRKVYRNCRIAGFTRPRGPVQETDSRGISFVSKTKGPEHRSFLGWLVLEMPDGRLAYVPPSAVTYMEQSAPQ